MLIKKGAEANIYLEEFCGRRVIRKWRLSKKYRIPELDVEIRLKRTIHEGKLIHKAKEAGVLTPTIYVIDAAESTMIMEFIDGKQVKKVLNNLSSEERGRLCRRVGELIGRLHNKGIIHGDLTTSNLILTSHGKVYFIDFGLGELSTEIEKRGVDVHLMKRAFESTHYKFANECFSSIMKGYAKVLGEKEVRTVLKKVWEIERRGRYISDRRLQNGIAPDTS